MKIPKLIEIDFGDVDANVEYYKSIKNNAAPAYQTAFVEPPLSLWSEFLTGDRFIVYGQKGTGKTALLRTIQYGLNEKGLSSDFIEFKDEILEEADLYDGVFTSAIDPNKLESSTHYLHILKRIFILKIIKLSLLKNSLDEEETLEDGPLKRLFEKVKETTLADLVELAFTSVHDAAKSLDLKEIPNAEHVDFVKLVKGQNDSLLRFFVKQAKKKNVKTRLFIDEVHFSFKDENTFTKDATLVRDCLKSVINLNQSFYKDGVDCLVYIAVRSEFLEHPVIAKAEISKEVISYGEEITWATFPNDTKHKVWNVVFERLKVTNPEITKSKFFEIYLPGRRAEELLIHTWAKPRDIVRFFNCAKQKYPNKSSLSHNEFRAVLRDYANQSWSEIRTGLASFFDSDGINKIEDFLGEHSEKQYRQRRPLNKRDIFDLLTGILDLEQRDSARAKFCARMLYVLGVLVMENNREAQTIYNSFHRNNLQPKWDWDIFFHMAVAKRFA